MSGPESAKPDDRLLDEFLAGQGAVREGYRAMAREQAPAQFDAAILLAAQAAARPAPRRRRTRWQTPIAAAAVMVLSFGVFLQVQRDPVVQEELMAAPERSATVAAPIATQLNEDAANTEVQNEAAPAREEADAETQRERKPVVVAKPKPAPLAKQRLATPADALPPSPAMVMADAPAPPVVAAAPAPEAAAMAAESAKRSATAEAMARESMQRQEPFAAAPAPMAKASRAPQTAHSMNEGSTSVPVASDTAVAAAMDQWAQTCTTESAHLSTPTRWRGLAVVSWARQADGDVVQTTLRFAPKLTREAITTSLGALAAKASLSTAECAAPMVRSLRQSGDGWALTCACEVARSK